MKRLFIIKVVLLVGLFAAGCTARVRQGVQSPSEPDNSTLVADASSLPPRGKDSGPGTTQAEDDRSTKKDEAEPGADQRPAKDEGEPTVPPDTGDDRRNEDPPSIPGGADMGGAGSAGPGAGSGDIGGGGGDIGGGSGSGSGGSDIGGGSDSGGSGSSGSGGGGFGGEGLGGGGFGGGFGGGEGAGGGPGGGFGGGEGIGGGAGPVGGGGDPGNEPVDNPKGERTDVPDVKGLTLAEARAKLTEAGFKVKLVKRGGRPVTFRENEDTVESQKPAPGSWQRPSKFGKGGTVALEVAVKVPNVTSNNLRVALRRLVNRNLRAAFSAEDLKQLRDRKIDVDFATRGGGRELPKDATPGTGAEGITVTSQTPGSDGPTVKQGTAVRLRLRFTGGQGGKVAVPAVVGETFVEARRRLEQAGLKIRGAVRGQETRRVTTQRPAAGTRVDRDSVVEVGFDAQPTVRVPAVTGISYREAKRRLEQVGLGINPVDRNQETLLVRTQNPAAGTTRPRGTVVVVGFGDQAGAVRVPRVVGLTYRDAKRRLEEAGLRVNQVNTILERRTVRTQQPPAGTQVRPGTQVALTVVPTGPGNGTETRPGTVAVPRLVGLTVEEARRALSGVGLSLQVRGGRTGRVASQSPPAGTRVATGGSVTVSLPAGR